MNLLDIYNARAKEQVTEQEAAEALGMTLKDFRFRWTRWGHRLPTLLATLDKIAESKITREEAAKVLEVTERQVNYLMQTWKVVRPIAGYVVEETVAEIKWEIRKKYAIEFIHGGVTIEEAAERAGVSTRQMRRWVSELLVKHFGIVWKDLKTLGPLKRGRLAHEIERAEGLEHTKQSVIDAISRGEMTIKEEAAARLAADRRNKGRVSVQRIETALIKRRTRGRSNQSGQT